jgi:hypothetical protein
MLFHLANLIVVMGFATNCLAGANEIRQSPVESRSRTSIVSDEAAQKALAAPIADQQLTGIRLSDAINELRQKAGVPLFVNWRQMAMIHISQDFYVTVGLHGKTLKGALDTVFTVVGADRIGDWAIKVEDGVIVVTSTDDFSENVSVRVYDVRDIFARAAADERQRRVDALVALIEDQIEPASWKQRGGQVGAIREINGQLIVTQTPQNQEKLAKLLGDVTALFVDPTRHSRP